LQFVELLESGVSRRAAATALGVRDETSWQWERAYRRGGLEAMSTIASRGPYSSDIRLAAIRMYMDGSTTREVVAAFDLGSPTTLEKWVARHRKVAVDGQSDRAIVDRSGIPSEVSVMPGGPRRPPKYDEAVQKRFAAAIDDGHGYEGASHRAGIPVSTGWHWYQRYRRRGALWLAPVTANRTYATELKLAAVRAYDEGATRADILERFDIQGSRTFEGWVSKYRQHGPAAFAARAKESVKAPTLDQLALENATLLTIVERLDPALPTDAKVTIVSSLADRFPVTALLRAIGLPRSTYYYRLSRKPRPDRYLEVRPLIRETFQSAYQAYGYRRVRERLRQAHGVAVSAKTVRRLMREEGCVCRSRRRRPSRMYRGALNQISPNILERNFTATAPNQKWVTDVTQFYITGQLVYLSPLIDLYNGEVLSYTLRKTPTLPLVTDMLKPVLAALGKQRPILHTDQGWQYQHASYRKILKRHRVTQSMSRKGNCHDNAAAESFFSHFKQEFVRGRQFASLEQFTIELDRYLRWYNHDRIKERLDWASPVQYRLAHQAA
jgi:putative transposase